MDATEKLERVREHRNIYKSSMADALKAVNEGWVKPDLDWRGRPVMSIDEAIAPTVERIRADFKERGLIALQHNAYACACEGAAEGMPDCSCALIGHAYAKVRGEVDEMLRSAGFL